MPKAKAAPAAPSSGRIREIVARIERAQSELDVLELKAAGLKAAINSMLIEDLPGVFKEMEIEEARLDDGTTVRIREEVSCGITEANRARAMKWLRDNDYGGIIKTSATMVLPIEGNEELLDQLGKFAEDHDANLDHKEVIHPATLTSFVKEQMRNASFPQALFSVYPFQKAKITKPAAARARR
jgi:hypothetical protein